MKTIEDMARLSAGIWNHYMAACVKQPQFADMVCIRGDGYAMEAESERAVLQQMAAAGREDIPADLAMDAALNDIYAACSNGDVELARIRLLDAVAVLLRMDDMLQEGRA